MASQVMGDCVKGFLSRFMILDSQARPKAILGDLAKLNQAWNYKPTNSSVTRRH